MGDRDRHGTIYIWFKEDKIDNIGIKWVTLYEDGGSGITR